MAPQVPAWLLATPARAKAQPGYRAAAQAAQTASVLPVEDNGCHANVTAVGSAESTVPRGRHVGHGAPAPAATAAAKLSRSCSSWC